MNWTVSREIGSVTMKKCSKCTYTEKDMLILEHEDHEGVLLCSECYRMGKDLEYHRTNTIDPPGAEWDTSGAEWEGVSMRTAQRNASHDRYLNGKFCEDDE
jgi:hypothetical protein